MCAEESYSSFKEESHRLRGSPRICAGAAKDQKRFDHVRRAENSGADVSEDFDALGFREPAGGEELGVGVDGCEVVAEVVRDGARHSADGGEPFGFKKGLVSLLNLAAHAGERFAELTHLARAVAGNAILTVAHTEGADALRELLERARKKARESHHQQSSGDERE